MISREQLLARREDLERQMSQARQKQDEAHASVQQNGNLIHALSGAIQDCDYFLKQLDPPGVIERPVNGLDMSKAEAPSEPRSN